MSRRSGITRWNGRQIVDGTVAATVAAVDETTVAARRDATGLAPASSRNALDSRPASAVGRRVRGEWGLYQDPQARRAIKVERGTARWPGIPYLQPAKDRQYPRLAERIRLRRRRG